MEHVIIDCSGSVGQEAVEALYAEALEATRRGDLERAGNIARQADLARLRAKPGPTERRVPLTDAEREQREKDAADAVVAMAAMYRADRNARLAATDWTVLPDAPLSKAQKDAWRAYRQELRDLTFGEGAPDWPAPPK